MRKLYLFIFSVVSCSVVIAQKTISDPNVQTRDVKGFHAISVSNGVEMILTQSDTEAVAVSAADPEDRDRIHTIVEDGVLKVFYDFDLWKLLKNKGNKKLKAYVSIIKVDRIRVAAGARVKAEGPLKAAALSMRVSSGAGFDGVLEVTSADVSQSSGSWVNISGAVKDLVCQGSSGSVFSGYGLVTEKCDARTSSGARIEITVNNELSVNATSGGYIAYKGMAAIRRMHTSSGGNVSKKS